MLYQQIICGLMKTNYCIRLVRYGATVSLKMLCLKVIKYSLFAIKGTHTSFNLKVFLEIVRILEIKRTVK